MDRPPRDPRQPILTFPLFMRTGLVSLLMLAGAFALFLWELRREGASLAEARTAVVNVIVMVEALYLLNCRSLTHSFWSAGVFSNLWLICGNDAWLRIIAVGIAAFWQWVLRSGFVSNQEKFIMIAWNSSSISGSNVFAKVGGSDRRERSVRQRRARF